MPENTPEFDLGALWRSQPVEPIEIMLDTLRLRQRSERLRSSSRRRLFNSLLLAALIAAGALFGISSTDLPLARALFAASAAWAVCGQFFLHRARTLAPPPHDAGLRTSLDSCRRELQRRIRFHRGALLWLQAPLLLAFNTWLATLLFSLGGGNLLVKFAAPALTILAVWALCTPAVLHSQEREFRRAIEELDQIEREP